MHSFPTYAGNEDSSSLIQRRAGCCRPGVDLDPSKGTESPRVQSAVRKGQIWTQCTAAWHRNALVRSWESYYANRKLRTITEGNIPTISVADIWGQGPFTVFIERISDIDIARDELPDLGNRNLVLILTPWNCRYGERRASWFEQQKLGFDFDSMKLDRFWCKLSEPYPFLTKQVIVQFVTSYLCE
jgi:hypothetical protein